MIKEFRVVIKEGDDDSVSAFSVDYALSDAGINVEYVETLVCYEDDDEEEDD